MQIRKESKEGPQVGPCLEVMSVFMQSTLQRQAEWCNRLRDCPDVFAEMEQEVDHHFRQGAGHMVAAMLGELADDPQMQAQSCRIREEAAIDLKSPEPRSLTLRLLCGLLLFVTTSYCAPRRRRDDGTEQAAGLYPELAALGVFKGCSPALQYRVARAVAWCPSMEVARKELESEGIVLDRKTVRRIAEQLGIQLLTLRQRELAAWRQGELLPSRRLAGKRIAVQIDGGRVRLRKNKDLPKQQPKGQHPKFTPEWREPKVLILYEFDERGRMKQKDAFKLIDGTLQGPDHLAELVAFHLHRWGASEAEKVVFVSDGAPWIWDRLDWIEKRAGLTSSQTERVLDFYHAAHHISLALASIGLKDDERKKHFAKLRRLLHQSRYETVIEQLEALAWRETGESDVWTEIRYLKRHGEAGHLSYATFRRRGIPCGSGAVESAIRRVINLRLKSNAVYWLEENAEAIFAVRALLLTDRWEETLKRVRHTMARDRRLDWHWDAPPTSCKVKPQPRTRPPQPQTTAGKQPTSLAT